VLLLGVKGPYPEANSFSVMNSYEVDTALLLSHALEQEPDAKIGAIYQADAMGEGIERGVQAVAEETGLELVAETTVDATAQDLTAQVTAMRRAGADHVLLGVSPGALIAAAGAVASLDYDVQLLNPGSGYTGSLLDLPVGPTLQEKLLTTCSYPLWDDEGEGIDEFKEALGDVPPHGSYINGWLSGMILEAVLRKAADDGDLSREGIVAAAGRTTVDTGGVTPPIAYGPSIDERTPYREGRVCAAAKDADGLELVQDWFTSDAAKSVELQ
jgi:branched-chain amino acid transport system substrate-binding protein